MNKKIPTVLGILIIIFLAGAVVGEFFLLKETQPEETQLSQPTKPSPPLPEEEEVLPEKTVEPQLKYTDCDKMEVSLKAAQCYADIAQQENQPEICNDAPQNISYECYTELAVREKDPHYCDYIDAVKWPNFRNQCRNMASLGKRIPWMVDGEISN